MGDWSRDIMFSRVQHYFDDSNNSGLCGEAPYSTAFQRRKWHITTGPKCKACERRLAARKKNLTESD
jgi:hypothetical protein